MSIAKSPRRFVRRSCVLFVLLAVWCNMLLAGSISCGVPETSAKRNDATTSRTASDGRDTKIETEDVLAHVGERFIIGAELEAKTFLGIANDLAYVPVEFYAGTRRLGSGITDQEGHAELALQFDKAQNLPVTNKFPGTKKYWACSAQSDVFILDDSRPILIVDIDHTVADVSSVGVIAKKPQGQNALPAAGEALTALAREYQIIFLTHRTALLAAKTKTWLRENKFPRAPVVFWHPNREPLLPQTFKTEAIAGLKQRFPRIVAGIGDRKSDAVAYGKNGLKAYILKAEGSERYYPGGTVFVSDWKEILTILKKDKEIGR